MSWWKLVNLLEEKIISELLSTVVILNDGSRIDEWLYQIDFSNVRALNKNNISCRNKLIGIDISQFI